MGTIQNCVITGLPDCSAFGIDTVVSIVVAVSSHYFLCCKPAFADVM